MTLTPDVAVVGGGPAGLSAALAARQAGATVILFDAAARPGGQYYRQPPDRLRGAASHRQAEGRRLWEEVAAAGVEIRSGWQAWNLTPERVLSVAGPGGSETCTARAVVVAAGAYERVLPFPGWTTPGVITAGAAQTLLDQGVRPGRRALVAGTGPLNLTTAAALLRDGVEVVAVLEGSPLYRLGARHATGFWGQWERLREGTESVAQMARHGTPYRVGWGLMAVHGDAGIEGATIARLDAEWRPISGSEREITCDTVCVGYGLTPFYALAAVAGAQLEWRPDRGGQVPLRDATFCTTVPGVYAVGDGAGIGGARMSMLEGEVAGIAAAALAGHGIADAQDRLRGLGPALAREERFRRAYAALFTPGPGAFERADDAALICRCEGVTLGMVRVAAAGGATTLVELKAATRCGMGECQGRMCDHAAAHALARFTGRSVAEVGLNHPRPPVLSLPLAQIADG